MARKVITQENEVQVLTNSRRRCAFCFCLNNDFKIKKGQIAHIDRDNSNSDLENLVFLCLEHHDEYDSLTSQSKGLKPKEIINYRDSLYEHIKDWEQINGSEFALPRTQKTGSPNTFVIYEMVNPASTCGYKYLAINMTREVFISFERDHISIESFYWEVTKWLNCDYKRTSRLFDFDLMEFSAFISDSFFSNTFSFTAFLDGIRKVFTTVLSISEFDRYYEIEYDSVNQEGILEKRADGFLREININDSSDEDCKIFFEIAKRLSSLIELKIDLLHPEDK
jgi:hypothetical protein